MSKQSPRDLPSPSKNDVDAHLEKTEAILLRLSKRDKAAITSAAKSVHLTATEYLVKCHELVSEKLSKS